MLAKEQKLCRITYVNVFTIVLSLITFEVGLFLHIVIPLWYNHTDFNETLLLSFSIS